MPGSKQRIPRRLLPVGVAFLATTALALAVLAQVTDRTVLWRIVHDRCVPDAAASGRTPCVEVDAESAVLKDLVGATQYLLIPTARVTGIESPALLAPDAPNYFAAAWRARRYLEQRAGHAMPRDTISLAINPPASRSQDQLHIHIDCLRPEVRATLATSQIGNSWAMLPTPFSGQSYLARRLAGDTLEPDFFRLVADELPGARDHMALYTLVAAGSSDPVSGDGFILLAGQAARDGSTRGEDLQDHGCALAKQVASP